MQAKGSVCKEVYPDYGGGEEFYLQSPGPAAALARIPSYTPTRPLYQNDGEVSSLPPRLALVVLPVAESARAGAFVGV